MTWLFIVMVLGTAILIAACYRGAKILYESLADASSIPEDISHEELQTFARCPYLAETPAHMRALIQHLHEGCLECAMLLRGWQRLDRALEPIRKDWKHFTPQELWAFKSQNTDFVPDHPDWDGSQEKFHLIVCRTCREKYLTLKP